MNFGKTVSWWYGSYYSFWWQIIIPIKSQTNISEIQNKINVKKSGIFLLNWSYDYSQPKILDFPLHIFYNYMGCKINYIGNI
jgi:hypothetical protein